MYPGSGIKEPGWVKEDKIGEAEEIIYLVDSAWQDLKIQAQPHTH